MKKNGMYDAKTYAIAWFERMPQIRENIILWTIMKYCDAKKSLETCWKCKVAWFQKFPRLKTEKTWKKILARAEKSPSMVCHIFANLIGFVDSLDDVDLWGFGTVGVVPHFLIFHYCFIFFAMEFSMKISSFLNLRVVNKHLLIWNHISHTKM